VTVVASVAVLSDIHPDVAKWADYFLHARASDADALAVMAPPRRTPARPTTIMNDVTIAEPASSCASLQLHT
jgi:hypothetical protein